ncbi:transposable element Tcb2 transposase [Trichonephila clavipes]|nr:transposable element Tcb2 transposase [Trichonephila clavipes]
MTVVFVCGDSVVNASILSLLHTDTLLPQQVSWYGMQLPVIHGHPLVLIRGTMADQWYVHDVLQPHVFSLMQRLLEAIFQKDNARSHMAIVSQDCLRTVITLPWPALSSDLSPIENIWDHLGWRVGHPTILNELEARLQQILNEIS